MRRALNLLRESLHYRRGAFDAGLQANGFRLTHHLPDPEPGDLLLIWNRHGGDHETALRFEAAGARVLVAENGYLGKSWLGGKWFALAWNHHNGAGTWPDGGPQRWQALGVELAPWKLDGDVNLVFEQRGIGEPGVASPRGWAGRVATRVHGRIRWHPGAAAPAVKLEDELADVWQCFTWNSGAALLALMRGVPVFYDCPTWIGAGAALPLSEFGKQEPRRDDAARLAMFCRMAWAQWTLDEIRSGEALYRLLR